MPLADRDVPLPATPGTQPSSEPAYPPWQRIPPFETETGLVGSLAARSASAVARRVTTAGWPTLSSVVRPSATMEASSSRNLTVASLAPRPEGTDSVCTRWRPMGVLAVPASDEDLPSPGVLPFFRDEEPEGQVGDLAGTDEAECCERESDERGAHPESTGDRAANPCDQASLSSPGSNETGPRGAHVTPPFC